MLIEKKLNEGDVASVKLMSGEELVGTVVTVEPLTLRKPIVLGMQQQQSATGEIEVGMAFGPFMLAIGDDAKVTVEKGTYIAVVKARDEIKQAYIKSTTGLAVPPSLIV